MRMLLPIGESGRVASRVVRGKEAYDMDSELQQGADGAQPRLRAYKILG